MDLASIVPVAVLHCAPYVKRCLAACTTRILQAAVAEKQAARNVLTAKSHHNDVATVDQSPRDSTSCPARSIATTDGVDPSFTLLVQSDLCESMKTAVRIQRLYSKEQRYAKAQLKEIKAFDSKLWQEITVLKKAIRNEENPELKAQWKSRLLELESLLNVAPAKKSNLEAGLKYRGEILLKAYAEIGAFLDQALVEATLADLDNDEELPIEKLDIDEQCLQRIQDQDYADPEYAAELAGPRIPDEYYGAVAEGVAAPQSPWPAGQKAEHADLVGDAQSVEQDAAAIEDEPAQRDNYIRIFPEDLEDYTPGPARFISATDGFHSPVVALLMRHDLSQYIKAAIKYQRMYDREKRWGEAQLEEIEQYDSQLRREINDRRYAPSEPSTAARPTWRDSELSILETLLKSVPLKKEVLKSRLRHRANVLLEETSEIMAFLEEAFVHALLCEPDSGEELPTERLNLEDDYQSLRAEQFPEEKGLPKQYLLADSRESQDQDAGTARADPEPLTPDAHYGADAEDVATSQPVSSPEDEAEHKARVAHWEARKSLETARQEFDSRADNEDIDLYNCTRAEENGEAPYDATQTEFDLRWVAINRQLTRDVIKAEEVLQEAEAKLLELGVELPEESAGYYGGGGYIEYYERDPVVDGNPPEDPRIQSWLHAISEASLEDPETLGEERGEILEWECREIEISDSLSAVDYDYQRSKIDKWQLACRSDREEACRVRMVQ
ncbi:uncharacterized protein MYCGRDRAFT_109248 [Zymoseptoria tritici IPO323]|uniref:Uncharacterized protein n=1 Tax=Zymoseptoria tritici (strain CBS 115943 / IPO323) TaxID=336722 RepID=F9XA41_ZYMTI|nr:uncharacterized protein MYCGRDRAFT_109248 [Zymoseptoria tritici IPO323]EGP88269.1 hypothetical protein MYCGRDRAFT_109248 [Zymoseptoria tritici IPO323]